jgi:hypothetical protein
MMFHATRLDDHCNRPELQNGILQCLHQFDKHLCNGVLTVTVRRQKNCHADVPTVMDGLYYPLTSTFFCLHYRKHL